MAKTKTAFFCQSCGAESPKWMGKCNACGEWNTLVEEIVSAGTSQKSHSHADHQKKSKPVKLADIQLLSQARIDTGNVELNRVLGGGIVPGSLILIGGDPGIGKSTLVIQVTLNIPNKKVLYVSGEESLQQLKMRADRIGGNNEDIHILSETNLDKILLQSEKLTPDVMIIDSIQTMMVDKIESSPGSISQVRESTAMILRYAKETNIPVIIIGHINKEGSIAGPKVLEHMVDTVLQFEGDKNYMYRILRGIKNRFGSTSELGIYEMQQSGLREVNNPSELLLADSHQGLSGVAVSAAIEGARPLLIEIQALVSSAVYPTPQRSTTGFDPRRLNMLLAVLEKRAGFRLVSKDVFLNIAGGIKVHDTAIDLAVISSILSSNIDAAIQHKVCLTGEVGLSGEVRPVSRLEQRIMEAEKLGFEQMIVPQSGVKGLDKNRFNIQIIPVSTVSQAFKALFKS